MSEKDKLDLDFQNFNLQIDKAAEEEIQRIRSALNAIKNQVAKGNEAVLNSSYNEEKRS